MDNEFEFYYPGVYDKEDTKILNAYKVKLAPINNKGEVNINELVNGKLFGTPGIRSFPWENNFKMTLENMIPLANSFVGNNPLFTDKEYAKKTKYNSLITFPLVLFPTYMDAMPAGIGDFMVISGHNDTMNYYEPVCEGDTIFTVIGEQHFEDITPAAGSQYRTFALSGTGKVFNQKGELVAEGANILKESFRRHKDPAKRNAGGLRAWESPDWWARKSHMYTDKDWEYIISIWKKEKVRGADILYWDDVKIGDEPTPNVTGPALVDTEMDMTNVIPQWATDIKKNMLDPKIFAKMVKNKQGIYVMAEHLEKKPAPPPPPGAPKMPPELSNRDGRAVLINYLGARWAASMLFNWMGDAGWLQRIGWDIMPNPPGYDESVIPHHKKKPALFDKFPYLDKVPYMKGKRANAHGMEGDVSINKAYVVNKYAQNGEYFVDLTWWCETIDNYIFEEGFATVKLPKKP